jgi:hypothetical protein
VTSAIEQETNALVTACLGLVSITLILPSPTSP